MTRSARALLVVVLAAAVVVTLVWLLQRYLIYFPDRSAPPAAGGLRSGAQDVTLRTSDGLRLTAWLLPPAAGAPAAPGVVLVAPGNAGNRRDRLALADALTAEGLAVLLLDYRGYGGNPGRPGEAGLSRDVRAAWAYLVGEAGFAPGRVILFGESLGAAVVTSLAADLCAAGDPPDRLPAGLVLRSPFTSLAAVGREHYPYLPVGALLRDRFEVRDRVAAITVPTAVVYGTGDQVVPPEQSREVAAAAAEPVATLAVPGADHNDPALYGGAEVIAAVRQIAADR